MSGHPQPHPARNVTPAKAASLGEPDGEGWRFWKVAADLLVSPYTDSDTFTLPTGGAYRAGCPHTPTGIGTDCACGVTVAPDLRTLAEYKMAIWDLWDCFPYRARDHPQFAGRNIAIGRVDGWEPVHPIYGGWWHLEHPHTGEDSMFLRATAIRLTELYLPATIDTATVAALHRRYNVPIHHSDLEGSDWLREICPTASPHSRWGCWTCGKRSVLRQIEYPFCQEHRRTRDQWLDTTIRNIVRRVATKT